MGGLRLLRGGHISKRVAPIHFFGKVIHSNIATIVAGSKRMSTKLGCRVVPGSAVTTKSVDITRGCKDRGLALRDNFLRSSIIRVGTSTEITAEGKDEVETSKFCSCSTTKSDGRRVGMGSEGSTLMHVSFRRVTCKVKKGQV